MSQIKPYYPFLLHGLLTTVEVTAMALVLGLVVAFVAAFGRLSEHRPLRWLAGAFIELFRGTSVIVQLFWFFYALPLLGVGLTPIEAAVLALGCNQGSYAAEIVRGSILSISRGQGEAAVALNMTSWQRMRRVILPQALPRMLPPFGNVSVDTLKATALVSLVTVSDLTFRAQIVRSSTGATTAIFGLILVVYFIISLIISFGFRWLERRTSLEVRPRRSSPIALPFLRRRVAG